MSKIFIEQVLPNAVYEGQVFSYLVHALLEDGTKLLLQEEEPLDLDNRCGQWIEVELAAPFARPHLTDTSNGIGYTLEGVVTKETNQYFFSTQGIRISIPEHDALLVELNIPVTLHLVYLTIRAGKGMDE